MDKVVIVAEFVYPHEAHIAKGILESEGIESFLKDELTVQVNNFYSNAIGGVKLQVMETDRDNALRILKESGIIEDPSDKDKSPENLFTYSREFSRKCPYCHSTEIRRKRMPGYMILFSILLLGFPFPFLKKRYFCFDCSKEWKVFPRILD